MTTTLMGSLIVLNLELAHPITRRHTACWWRCG